MSAWTGANPRSPAAAAAGGRTQAGRGYRATEPVEGELIGGCAETSRWPEGHAIWPPPSTWDGAMFLLELSEEAPHRRPTCIWLQNYVATGVLGRLGALLVAAGELHAAGDVRAVGRRAAGARRSRSS